MPNTTPTIPNFPPQGIQAQLDLLYIYNPDAVNKLVAQLDAGLIKIEELQKEIEKALQDMQGVLRYKGSVQTEADLPATGNVIGDVWNIISTDENVAWTGAEWDKFGSAIDTSAFLTKTAAKDLYINADASTYTLATLQDAFNYSPARLYKIFNEDKMPTKNTFTLFSLGWTYNDSNNMPTLLASDLQTGKFYFYHGDYENCSPTTWQEFTFGGDALAQEVETNKNNLADLGDQVSTIESKIPGDASSTNQLATKSDLSSIDALPPQDGNAGKFLTTDGQNASWRDIEGGAQYPSIKWTVGPIYAVAGHDSNDTKDSAIITINNIEKGKKVFFFLKAKRMGEHNGADLTDRLWSDYTLKFVVDINDEAPRVVITPVVIGESGGVNNQQLLWNNSQIVVDSGFVKYNSDDKKLYVRCDQNGWAFSDLGVYFNSAFLSESVLNSTTPLAFASDVFDYDTGARVVESNVEFSDVVISSDAYNQFNSISGTQIKAFGQPLFMKQDPYFPGSVLGWETQNNSTKAVALSGLAWDIRNTGYDSGAVVCGTMKLTLIDGVTNAVEGVYEFSMSLVGGKNNAEIREIRKSGAYENRTVRCGIEDANSDNYWSDMIMSFADGNPFIVGDNKVFFLNFCYYGVSAQKAFWVGTEYDEAPALDIAFTTLPPYSTGGSSLPDQTGHTGFLQTNGTNTTWNDRIHVSYDVISLGANSYSYSSDCVFLTHISNQGVAQYQVIIGDEATGGGYGAVAIGGQASASASDGIAIGNAAKTTAQSSIQIGWGTNSDAGTMCVSVGTGRNHKNVTLLNSGGTIPSERLAAVPAEEGTYTLKATVAADGTVTMAWVKDV